MARLVCSSPCEAAGQVVLRAEPAQGAGDAHQVRKGDGEGPA